MCRVYGQSYSDTMGMPMRAFWQFSGYTDRLLTAEGIDHLHLSVAAQSPEGAQNALEEMQSRAPNPIKFTAHAMVAATSQRDEEGIQALRSMAAG